jgi:hypothetical protein
MYLIINRASGKTTPHEGDFPLTLVEELLLKGDDIIVISLYSNTIKIPAGFNSAISEWDWVEYPLPIKDISEYYQEKLDDNVYYGYAGIDSLYAVAVKKGTSYKDIVNKMRNRINEIHPYSVSSIMWEDLEEITKEDYLSVLN